MKKAQDVMGSRNDRSTASERIDKLSRTVAGRHGKVAKRLQEALQTRALPELELSELPGALLALKNRRCQSPDRLQSVTFCKYCK